MGKLFRKLDNTAKAFSLTGKKTANTFRLSVTLKGNINSKLLKKAVNKTLDIYPSYKVKLKTGFFWNYFESNDKLPVVEKEINSFDLNKTNDYLFRVTYLKNKINLDVCHILTDGLGAIILLKSILYNYLNLKYDLKTELIQNNSFSYQDEYLKKVNKKLICRRKYNESFLIKEKAFLLKNKTNHYMINIDTIKNTCKNYGVSMSEYLTAIYIYALYKTTYDKSSNKDIIVTVPIDLRKFYNVESFSNFFTCMNVEGNVLNDNNVSFEKILEQVHNEFKDKLNDEDIPKYLSRDVRLGTNVGINLIPLFIKKPFMKCFSKFVGKSTTSTFSNVGPIKVENQYKKYINDIVAFAKAGTIQKIKCTTCSYEKNLIITINSNLISNTFEKEFLNLLKKYIGTVKLKNSI